MKRALLASLVPVAFAVACGGNEPPPKGPEPVAMPTPNRAEKPKLSLSQELGSLDPKKVDEAFDRAKPKILACQAKGLKRLDFLAGDAKFYARLDTSGKVKWIFFEESQIGDRETEKCVLDALTSVAWPAPDGGEGELHKGFGYDLQDAREPTAWGPDKAAPHLGEIADQVKHCRGGKNLAFKVTAYIEPEAKHGKVAAVGVAAGSKEAAEKADCIAEAVKQMKFPSPGGYAAKVSFSL
ncbi:MAG: hypothetical protein U0183_05105 [Polyangiaceae bacterium]